MKANQRTVRVSQQIQVELAKIIPQQVKDPRLGVLTITGVEVSQDFAFAKVFVVFREKAKEIEQLKVLNNAAGFLRRCLGKELQIRMIPALAFSIDRSSEYGNRIDELLRKANIQPESPSDEE
jgi:ribosome-binding factor A